MRRVKFTLPVRDVDADTMRQIEGVLSIPSFMAMAVMPDVHLGYDLPIGCVALLNGQISPSFVGYDIGCGMLHLNLGKNVPALASPESRKKLFKLLYELTPAGVGGKHNSPRPCPVFNSARKDRALTEQVMDIAPLQIGTLGGGNHFIEIGRNPHGEYGITIHSGSRNAGHSIASYYMAKARLLDLNSKLGKAYVKDMHWALNYALENRSLMLNLVMEAIFGQAPKKLPSPNSGLINENHNHAEIQPGNRVLHRKGATPAENGQLGIIPINQRDGTYITRGLGNRDFLCSASHGAGRAMSRAQARKTIKPADLGAQMQGIICRTDKAVCDEGPDAYKPADMVIGLQNGLLIDVIDHFKPLIVMKG